MFKKCGPRSDCSYIGAVCSGCTLFASILISSVMLGNYLQQTMLSDAFFLDALRAKLQHSIYKHIFSAIVKISVDPVQALEAS